MAILFLLVALEIKRELMEGELSTMQRASLPAIAAAGGMLVPARPGRRQARSGVTRSHRDGMTHADMRRHDVISRKADSERGPHHHNNDVNDESASGTFRVPHARAASHRRRQQSYTRRDDIDKTIAYRT